MQFETLQQANAALEGCKDTMFNGRRLTVEYVAPDAPRPVPKEQRMHDGPMRHAHVPDPRAMHMHPMCAPHDARMMMPPMRRPYDRGSYPPGRLERSRPPPSYRPYLHPDAPYLNTHHDKDRYDHARSAPKKRRIGLSDEGAREVDPEERFDPARTAGQQRSSRPAGLEATAASAKHNRRSSERSRRRSSDSPPIRARRSPGIGRAHV